MKQILGSEGGEKITKKEDKMGSSDQKKKGQDGSWRAFLSMFMLLFIFKAIPSVFTNFKLNLKQNKLRWQQLCPLASDCGNGHKPRPFVVIG